MKTPWHLWLIGAVTLLWNAGGAFDYLMTSTRTEFYVKNFTPAQLDYFNGFAAWAMLSWAVGVWFALLGSVLLLWRSRYAVVVFTLSFVGMIITALYSYLFSGVSIGDLMGPGAIWFSLLVMLVGLSLILYARAMRRRGVLR